MARKSSARRATISNSSSASAARKEERNNNFLQTIQDGRARQQRNVERSQQDANIPMMSTLPRPRQTLAERALQTSQTTTAEELQNLSIQMPSSSLANLQGRVLDHEQRQVNRRAPEQIALWHAWLRQQAESESQASGPLPGGLNVAASMLQSHTISDGNSEGGLFARMTDAHGRPLDASLATGLGEGDPQFEMHSGVGGVLTESSTARRARERWERWEKTVGPYREPYDRVWRRFYDGILEDSFQKEDGEDGDEDEL